MNMDSYFSTSNWIFKIKRRLLKHFLRFVSQLYTREMVEGPTFWLSSDLLVTYTDNVKTQNGTI